MFDLFHLRVVSVNYRMYAEWEQLSSRQQNIPPLPRRIRITNRYFIKPHRT